MSRRCGSVVVSSDGCGVGKRSKQLHWERHTDSSFAMFGMVLGGLVNYVELKSTQIYLQYLKT